MVQIPNLGKVTVKSEREDYFDPDYGFIAKKPKIEHPSLQQWSTDKSSSTVEPHELQHTLVSEPSPLGLRLKKSDSFVEILRAVLSQSNSTSGERKLVKDGNRSKTSSGLSSSEKLKASNFPAKLLRIGNWERVSRYEGDLVGKFYFAKHKLVWEVLDGGLKSKIEVQWSDIEAIKTSFTEDGPDTLEIVLSRQPLFFRETNPQPRKHTLWQATADFTGGQATINRRHYMECQQGFMSRHFNKLIRCDPRIYALSQQPVISLDKPFFEHNSSLFEEGNRFESISYKNFRDIYQTSEPVQLVSPSLDSSVSGTQIERTEPDSSLANANATEQWCKSAMGSWPTDTNNSCYPHILHKIPARSNDLKVPGLRPSMSKSEIMNQIGHHIYRQINSTPQNQPITSDKDAIMKTQFEELSQHLLGDSQNQDLTSDTDEKYIMSRVNSLYSLVQKEKHENRDVAENDTDSKANLKPNDSFSDLVMSLPRITSYPNFL